MTLTEWWQAFADDLDGLAAKTSNTQTAPWFGARTMIAEGVQIEANLLWGRQYAKKIDAAACKLGSPFNNPYSGQLMHLPDVNTPDSLLFALIYHHHLVRYAAIEQGNSLVLSQLINRRPEIQCAATTLKQRIDLYVQRVEHRDAIYVAYPAIALQEGATFLEQIELWLTEESVTEKLIDQLEIATAELIDQYKAGQASLHNVVSLFGKIEHLLSAKVVALREIVAYKKLIELLNEQLLLVDELSEPYRLRNNYPYWAQLWLDLDSSIPQVSPKTMLAVQGTRTVISSARFTASLFSRLIQNTLGRIAPQFIKDLCFKTATAVDDLTQSITPVAIMERRKQLLIQQADAKILLAATALNSSQGQQINAQDLKKMSAAEVSSLADKLALIHHMATLIKCLTIYQQEHTTGLTKFSLSVVFRPITTLLSKTFMRRLIFNGVLLVLEAEKLEREVNQLIQKAKTTTELDQEVVKDEFTMTLKSTKRRTTDLLEENLFVFFQREGKIAMDHFNGVVTKASAVLSQCL